MKRKHIFKTLTPLFGMSLLFGSGLTFQLINKDRNYNSVLAEEGTPLPASGGALSSGTYYLDGDMTLTDYISVNTGNDVVINLNGFTLNGSRPKSDSESYYVSEDDVPIVYLNGGTLTINGSDDDGKKGTLSNGSGWRIGGWTRGGAIAVYGGEATINDCNFTNNKCCFGSAIFVIDGNTATLNNCSIYNNKAFGGWGLLGAIYAEGTSSTVNINGGEIYGNEAGIYIWYEFNEETETASSSKVNLNGVHIHDNENYGVYIDGNDENNPALTISGDTIIKNNSTLETPEFPGNLRIKSSNQGKVEVISELGDNASIGITMTDDKGVFTNSANTSYNDASKFFSDDTNYSVAKDGDGQLILTNAVASLTNGNSVTMCPTFDGAITAWNAASDGAILTLLKDATVSGTTTISSKKTFDLNGYGLNANGGGFSIFTVESGGDLTLNDSGITTHYFTISNLENNGAGLGTICDEATYNAASENARGTFKGGYLTGSTVSSPNTINPYPGGGMYIKPGGIATMNGGTMIGMNCSDGAGCIGNEGDFTLNDGSLIYNRDGRGAICSVDGTININGGSISYNTSRGTSGKGCAAAIIAYGQTDAFYLNGGTICNNASKVCAIAIQVDCQIKGSPIIKDNMSYGDSESDWVLGNFLTYWQNPGYIKVVGELNLEAPIGVTIGVNYEKVITNTDTEYLASNIVSNFFSEKTGYKVGKIPVGSDKSGQLYIDETAVVDFIDKVEDVTPLTYNGGSGDSLDDIVDTLADYYELTSDQQNVVNEVNYNKLIQAKEMYDHVHAVGNLINEIPTPSDSSEYYDAINLAIEAYNKLTEEEISLLNGVVDFEEILKGHLAIKETIELILQIGDVTYNGSKDDSLDDIVAAEDAYNALSDEQKVLVDLLTDGVLGDDRETYDNIDNTVKLIDAIGDVNYGGKNDSFDDIEAAREAYDQLSDEEKAIVESYNNSEQILKDAEDVYEVIELISNIDDVTYDENTKQAIDEAREAYNKLSKEQKQKIKPSYLNILVQAENQYESFKTGDLLFRILLFIFGILLIVGLILLSYLLEKKKKIDSELN